MHIVTRPSIFLLLAATVLSSSAFAQALPAAPRPMATDEQRPASASADRATEAVIEAQLKMAERPDTAARVAAFKRNLYEALLKKGFAGDQAMQITIATPLPATSNSR